MQDHFIVGLLYQWLIIIHSSGIAIKVILSMSRIYISTSYHHRRRPTYSIHTGTLSILRWLHQISLLIHEYYSNGTKSHHHHHLQAASSTSSSGSLTNIASFSQMVSFHRAIIGTSKLLFSKEGKCIQLVDLIPYISVHELVFFWDVMFSTHGDTVCWQRQANSCSYWFHSTYR